MGKADEKQSPGKLRAAKLDFLVKRYQPLRMTQSKLLTNTQIMIQAGNLYGQEWKDNDAQLRDIYKKLEKFEKEILPGSAAVPPITIGEVRGIAGNPSPITRRTYYEMVQGAMESTKAAAGSQVADPPSQQAAEDINAKDEATEKAAKAARKAARAEERAKKAASGLLALAPPKDPGTNKQVEPEKSKTKKRKPEGDKEGEEKRARTEEPGPSESREKGQSLMTDDRFKGKFFKKVSFASPGSSSKAPAAPSAKTPALKGNGKEKAPATTSRRTTRGGNEVPEIPTKDGGDEKTSNLRGFWDPPKLLALSLAGRNYHNGAALFRLPGDDELTLGVLDVKGVGSRNTGFPGYSLIVPIEHKVQEWSKIPKGLIDTSIKHGHRFWRAPIFPQAHDGVPWLTLDSPHFINGCVSGSDPSEMPHSDYPTLQPSILVDSTTPDLWFRLTSNKKDSKLFPKPNAQSQKEPKCGLHKECQCGPSQKKACPMSTLRDAAGVYDDHPCPDKPAWYNPKKNLIRCWVPITSRNVYTLEDGGPATEEMIDIHLTSIDIHEAMQLRGIVETLAYFRVEALMNLEAPSETVGEQVDSPLDKPGAGVFNPSILTKKHPGYVFGNVFLGDILPPYTLGLRHCGLFRPGLQALFQRELFDAPGMSRLVNGLDEETLEEKYNLNLVDGRWVDMPGGDEVDPNDSYNLFGKTFVTHQKASYHFTKAYNQQLSWFPETSGAGRPLPYEEEASEEEEEEEEEERLPQPPVASKPKAKSLEKNKGPTEPPAASKSKSSKEKAKPQASPVKKAKSPEKKKGHTEPPAAPKVKPSKEKAKPQDSPVKKAKSPEKKKGHAEPPAAPKVKSSKEKAKPQESPVKEAKSPEKKGHTEPPAAPKVKPSQEKAKPQASPVKEDAIKLSGGASLNG